MTSFTNEIFGKYQMRKSFKQKKAFRKRLTDKMISLGYKVGEERHGLFQKTVNVTVGDVDKAEILFTAHYDTSARRLFPGFVTPKKPALFIGFRVLCTILVICIAVLIQEAVFFLTKSTPLSMTVYFVFLIGILWLMLYGPANKNTANDNTSGVCVLCEALQSLSCDDLKNGKAAFVFFDNSEKAHLGALFYKRRHKKYIRKQTVINLDCVGDGDHFLFICSNALINDIKLRDELTSCAENHPQKANIFCGKKKTSYSSDQRCFEKSMSAAAFCNIEHIGLYLGRIHTKRDTVMDGTNTELFVKFINNVVLRGKR